MQHKVMRWTGIIHVCAKLAHPWGYTVENSLEVDAFQVWFHLNWTRLEKNCPVLLDWIFDNCAIAFLTMTTSFNKVGMLFCFVLLLACYIPNDVDAGSYMVRKDYALDGDCKYTGYVPGGGLPNIKPITAPVATMPASAIAKIAGLGSKSTALAMHSSNMLKALEKGGKVFLSIAPKLAASLGIFGAALGFVSAFTKPSPQDILDQANKAIAQLTKDVNDRLDKMKGYVDTRVITLEKELMTKEYRTMFNFFGSCVKEFSTKDVNKCMRQAEKTTSSSSPKFMVLDASMSQYNPYIPEKSVNRPYFEKNGGAPSYYDTKRIEAGLVTFKDYANLHLMIISTLVNTYKGDMSKEGKHYYQLYLKEQKTAAEKYSKYAKWAYKWVKIRNYEEDINGKFKRYCSKPKVIREGGWPGVQTQQQSHCWVECSGLRKRCKYRISIRVDGKTPSSYQRMYFPGVHSYFSAAKYHGKGFGDKTCQEIQNGLKHDITTYWDGILMNNVKVWDEIAAKVTPELAKLPASDPSSYVDFAVDDLYNEDYARRINNAIALTNEQIEEETENRDAAQEEISDQGGINDDENDEHDDEANNDSYYEDMINNEESEYE
eukprot:gene8847-9795_t